MGALESSNSPLLAPRAAMKHSGSLLSNPGDAAALDIDRTPVYDGHPSDPRHLTRI